jgi:antitoxin component of MazEF toxin-antitoxin module
MVTPKSIDLTLPLKRYGMSLGITVPKRTLEIMGYQEGDLVIIKLPFQRLKDNVTEKRRLE